MNAPPRVGVAGLGLVGGSLLQGLAAAGAGVVGFDIDPAAAGAAARAGFAVADDAASLARSSDVLVVCVPPGATPSVVAAALEADPRVVVADASSVKAPIVAAVAARVDTGRYVPAHPLAGAAPSGWAAADPALLRDAVWAVCPSAADAPVEPLCAFSAALEPLSPRLVACSAEDHDAAVARTSHVPHLVAQALAALTAGEPLAAALSGGAFRDMTRTAAADEALWLSILLANRDAALPALAGLRRGLGDLAAALEAGDEAALSAAWNAGAAERARVEELRWAEPAWRARSVAGWGELLELGRAGIAVRRLRATGDGLELEASG